MATQCSHTAAVPCDPESGGRIIPVHLQPRARETMANSVELVGVTKTFGAKRAVDRLDLAVPEAAVYGFVGPNGSGKTTTLRLMLRIFQPDSGRVIVLGSDRGTVADDRLGYLPEERGLYKRLTVVDQIMYFARLKGFTHCRDAVHQWLDRLGAGSWASQRVEALSKGMAQKVQFIIAVIANPKLVILDEPFAGLDPVNREVLKEAILSLRAGGTTVVLSTHDMAVAEELCDSVLMIFQGRKVLDGSLAEIRSQYPIHRIRLRLAGDARIPDDLPGVISIQDVNGFQVLNLVDHCDPQIILRRLVASTAVAHFEVMQPTLHDIFVKIARPIDP
jgi:ABC-2 type transport system ATP-binding protein